MRIRASFGPSNLVAVCTFAIMFAIAPIGAGELAPELEAVLAAAGPNDMVPAIVVLEAFPDERDLLADVRGLEPEARRARVVERMRNFAGSSQRSVRALMAQAPAAVDELCARTFWRSFAAPVSRPKAIAVVLRWRTRWMCREPLVRMLGDP